MADGRTRNWISIFYPDDSAPDNWREIINSWHVAAFVSPLHDADMNADNEEKKPHRHLVILYDGPKTYEQVCEDIAPLKGTIPQRCKSLVGAVRYLTHLDNPEKAQYSRDDVLEFGGACYDDVIKLSQTDRHTLLKDMRAFIIDNCIIDFHEFQLWCDEFNEEWSRALDDSCTMQISQFLKSIYLKQRREREEAAYARDIFNATRIDKKEQE